MKRITLLGVLSGLIALSCSWFDNHNDIAYPAIFDWAGETPGDPVTLNVKFWFEDQTPDTSGVIFDWGQRGDTLWFLLQGRDGDIQCQDTFRNGFQVNFGVLDTGTYSLLFEGEDGIMDTFGLVVEDSLYRFVHRQKTSIYDSISGKVVFFRDGEHDTLRRIFKDMLLVELAGELSDPTPYRDSITVDLSEIGAEECHLTNGTYSMFRSGTWNDAIENGLIGNPASRFFTYDGDTMRLDSLFEVYIKKYWLGALSFRMGNGFDRYFFAFSD